MESSVPGCIANWEIHGFRTMEDLDIGQITEEAMSRWLRPNEIHAILCNSNHFNIKVKPVDLPKSGTIVLFDRKMLRNFRKDGHNWKKKKDGKTVKEAHEHLKVGNEERIHVYYAHGLDNPNFVRRCYWLLDKRLEHIVLVHYREVTEENVNQGPTPPRESKEALSLSNRMHLGSPFTPVNSSPGSVYSGVSGSRGISEETDSGVDCAFYTGSGTSLVGQSTELGNHFGQSMIESNHNLRLHEINTLEWDDLLGTHISADSAAPQNNEALSFDQQTSFELRDSGNNAILLPSHNFPDGISTLGHPTNSISGRSSVGFNNRSNTYFQPMGDQKSLFETDPNAPKEFENVTSDENMDMLLKGSLQNQDSFGRMMNYIMNDSLGLLDDPTFEKAGVPVMTDQTSIQELVFTITDVSPAWAFSTEETKVILIVSFDEAQSHLMGSNLFIVFGDTPVPSEVVQAGIFRCRALPHSPGFVSLYLSMDGRTPISQTVSFEYRSLSSNQMNSGVASPEIDNSMWDDLQVQMRLAHLLFSTKNSIKILPSKIPPNALREAKKFASLTSSYEKDWAHLIETIENNEISFTRANESLFELTLKNKLREWLLERIIEGSKTPPRDRLGQGVIHLCAILGYAWAVYPFACSGLSLDFRDAFGWTALHWAAYYGREQMVGYLLSAGANPSLVSDPTSEFPGGCTAADLAFKNFHEGLAGYLAEQGLTAHLKAMTLSGKISDPLPASTSDLKNPENLSEEELCMKDSLAAYRTAADAAARIQVAFREHSLKLQASAAELANPEIEALTIVSALKIQHAYRNYNVRKRMAAAAQIQHRFRSWKIRKDFLDMRKHAIRIQAVFRGHQVRKQYRKILWSVGVLEKAILRWRLKRKGLRGGQVEPTEACKVDQVQEDNVEEDFYQISRRQAEDRIERSVIRVQAMFRSHQAQKDYRRMKLAYDQAKAEFSEFLDHNLD